MSQHRHTRRNRKRKPAVQGRLQPVLVVVPELPRKRSAYQRWRDELLNARSRGGLQPSETSWMLWDLIATAAKWGPS